MPADKVREYNDYTFDFARENRDVVFGHWLNFDPHRKDEGLAEWRRSLVGCDFPALGYERVVNDWIAQGYSDDVLDGLFFRNAEAYFNAAPT